MANVLSSNMLSQKVSGSTASPQSRTDDLKTDDEKKSDVQLVPLSPPSKAVEIILKAHLAQLSTKSSTKSIVGNKLFYADSIGFNILDNTTRTGVASNSSTIWPCSPLADIVHGYTDSQRQGGFVRLRRITVRGNVRIFTTTVTVAAPSVMPTVRIAIVKDRMPLLTTYGGSSGLITSFLPNADPTNTGTANQIWTIGNTGWSAGQYPVQLCLRNRNAYDRYEVIEERLIDDWKIPLATMYNSTAANNLGNTVPQKNFEFHVNFRGQGELIQFLDDQSVVGYNQVNAKYYIVAMTDNAPTPPNGIDIAWGWSSEVVFDDTPADT